MNILAIVTLDANRNATEAYFLDGIEITRSEYDAVQIAALNRFCNGDEE